MGKRARKRSQLRTRRHQFDVDGRHGLGSEARCSSTVCFLFLRRFKQVLAPHITNGVKIVAPMPTAGRIVESVLLEAAGKGCCSVLGSVE